jgi:hypothetical protein
MAAIPTSPAVVFVEKDNSAYPPNIDSSIVGIVGYATKGPENEATLVTSQENLIRIFGNPVESLPGQGLEGALEILEATNQVRYVRAVPTDALNASATLKIGACPAVVVNGLNAGMSTATYSAISLVVSVKDSDGVQVVDPTTYVIYSSLDVPTSYGQASALGRVIGVGSNPKDALSVYWDSSSTDATVGRNNGILVGSWAGTNARLSVSSFSGVYGVGTYSGINALQALNASGDVLTAASSVTASGFTWANTSLNYLATTLYKGSGYNLGTNLVTGQTSGISLEVDTVAGPNVNISVNNDGVTAETFNVSLINSTNFVESIINIGSTNTTSDYIKGEIAAVNSTSLTPTPITNFYDKVTSLISSGTIVDPNGASITTSATPRFNKFIESASVSVLGGTDGTGVDADLIGTASPKTGMKVLDDDSLNISIAIVPGISSQNVQNELVTLAEKTQNFVAVVSPPMGLSTVQKASDWMNGKGSNGRTAAINSSWAAVFWPWVQIYNVFSYKDMWYDPAIFAVRQMVFTDNVAEPWFAPAGFRRGRLTKPTATEVSLNQGDRDNLYVTNLNPIVNFIPEGITIFGQKTAQRAATSLDRINVRRLMIYLRKVLLQTGRIDLFEPNDAYTWDLVKDKAEGVLSDIQARRGITDFKVICDDTVNTPVRVDRNELWCKILLKPTKTAEWIVFEVNLTNQSAKFSG